MTPLSARRPVVAGALRRSLAVGVAVVSFAATAGAAGAVQDVGSVGGGLALDNPDVQVFLVVTMLVSSTCNLLDLFFGWSRDSRPAYALSTVTSLYVLV